MSQTEIHPDSFTCSRKDFAALLFGYDNEIDVSQCIALYGERFDYSLNRVGLAVFVFPPHDGDFIISMESIPSLFEREAGIPAPLFERGWRLSSVTLLLHVVKERFVGAVDPLNNILNSLAPKNLPIWMKRSLDLCDVFHQPVGRKVLPIQMVVPAVYRNAVVPDGSGNVDTVIQMFVLFVLALQIC